MTIEGYRELLRVKEGEIQALTHSLALRDAKPTPEEKHASDSLFFRTLYDVFSVWR